MSVFQHPVRAETPHPDKAWIRDLPHHGVHLLQPIRVVKEFPFFLSAQGGRSFFNGLLQDPLTATVDNRGELPLTSQERTVQGIGGRIHDDPDKTPRSAERVGVSSRLTLQQAFLQLL